MNDPVCCGLHSYMGFFPCPRCARITPPAPPVPRVEVIADSTLRPWWLPGFIFRWMAAVVSKTQRVSQKR